MWLKVGQFIWNHFWKMFSALLMIGFWAFVDSVQQPEKVRATIVEYGREIAYLKDDNLQFKVSLGTNTTLYNKIDGKLDKLTDAVVELKYAIKKR